MPKYEYPGVYVEESDAQAHEIPGVEDSIDPDRLQSLIGVMCEIAPGWTDFNESDPGITLPALFAWLAEQLTYRANALPARGRDAMLRAAQTILSLSQHGTSSDMPPRRPNFFAERLLDATTLQQEQDYHRQKLRRHRLVLHGAGIVSGLGVRVEPATSTTSTVVAVEPGYAIGPTGELLALPHAVRLSAPIDGTDGFVTLRPFEHPCGTTTTGDSSVADCIEEATAVGITAAVPPDALAVARLTRTDGGWAIDPAYRPARIG